MPALVRVSALLLHQRLIKIESCMRSIDGHEGNEGWVRCEKGFQQTDDAMQVRAPKHTRPLFARRLAVNLSRSATDGLRGWPTQGTALVRNTPGK